MRIGTILKNPWTSYDNPTCISIYMGIKGRFFETMSVYDRAIEFSKYRKSDLDKFEVLGFYDLKGNIDKELKSYIKNINWKDNPNENCYLRRNL